MKAQWTGLFLSLVTVFAAGCSNVGFESIPKLSCDSSSSPGTSCQLVGSDLYYNMTFHTGDVDILIVDDNSGSMWAHQQQMAKAFPNFISQLSGLFYQMAIITTDVSASPNNGPSSANGNGAFQDGQFLPFQSTSGVASGLNVINQSTSNADDLFRGTIQRQETLNCQNANFATGACPSDDERGIYALNMAADRNQNGFFRTGAPLEVIILSNEDERSMGGVNYNDGNTPSALENYDQPGTFVAKMAALYPTKIVTVHSVVTDSQACLKSQFNISTAGTVTFGYLGTQYMSLSNPSSALMALGHINMGTVGSICAVDYGAQIGSIAQEVANNAKSNTKQLPCNPDPTKITLTTVPADVAARVQYTINSTNNQVTFSNVPTGTTVTFSYQCPRF
jgi:hypothetical protein